MIWAIILACNKNSVGYRIVQIAMLQHILLQCPCYTLNVQSTSHSNTSAQLQLTWNQNLTLESVHVN